MRPGVLFGFVDFNPPSGTHPLDIAAHLPSSRIRYCFLSVPGQIADNLDPVNHQRNGVERYPKAEKLARGMQIKPHHRK